MKFNFKKKWILLSCILSVILVLGYAYFIEPNRITTEHLDLELGCTSNSDDNFKFVQISDLHFTKETSENKISDIYNKIRINLPSAVFVTGDLISDKSGMEKAAELIEKISSEYPTYIVFGNWDYWALDFDVKDFTMQLEKAGASVLTNKNVRFDVDRNNFYIMGVKDPYTSGENAEDIDKAIKGIDFEANSCKILLAHSPNIIKYAKNRGIDIILVGHTHGGQVFIPFLSDYFIPSKREAGRGYVRGLYSIGDDRMYVNRGIGISVLPFRLMASPEITLVNID